MAPLSHKRKRVDNSDVEERLISKYDALWKEMEKSLTDLGTVMDSHNSELDHLRATINYLKDVLMLNAGKVPNSLQKKESNGLGEQLVDDRQPLFQSGRSSYNVAIKSAALEIEIDEFLARVDEFINQVCDHLQLFCTRTRKIKPNISLLSEMLRKASGSPASVPEIPASK